jgi:hypothetical protein
MKKKHDDGKHIDVKRMRSGYDSTRNWVPSHGRLGEKREDTVDHATAYTGQSGPRPAEASYPIGIPGKIGPAIQPNWHPTNGGGFREQIKGGVQFAPLRSTAEPALRWNDPTAAAKAATSKNASPFGKKVR